MILEVKLADKSVAYTTVCAYRYNPDVDVLTVLRSDGETYDMRLTELTGAFTLYSDTMQHIMCIES